MTSSYGQQPPPPPGRGQEPPPPGGGQYGEPGGRPPAAGGPGQQRPGEKQRGPKRPISVGQILGGILFVLVIIFIFENTRKAQVRLIGPQYTMPIALPIVIAAVLGALIAWLLRYRRHRHHPSGKSQRR